MKSKFLYRIVSSLLDFRENSEGCFFTIHVSSRDIRLFPGPENILYDNLITLVCKLCYLFGSSFFISCDNNKPYIVIYFPSR